MKKTFCCLLCLLLLLTVGCADNNNNSQLIDESIKDFNNSFTEESFEFREESIFVEYSDDEISETPEKETENSEVSEIISEESEISEPIPECSETSDEKIETSVSPEDNTYLDFTENDFSAETVFLFNVTTEEFIFELNTDRLIVPASITKLLTALYAFETLPNDIRVSPGNELFLLKPNSSVAGLLFSDVFTLEQLIAAMLMPSGNDAAYTVAAATARHITGNPYLSGEEAITVFMDKLNEYAASIGCTSTSFIVPDGYAYTDHYTTAYDLAIIAKHVLSNETLVKYTSMAEFSFETENGHRFSFKNTNAHVNPSSRFYREGVNGLKTGTLGKCSLLVSYIINEEVYVIGIINSETHESRYIDSCKIIDRLIQIYNK